MNKKMISVIYGAVLVMMLAIACLVAADVLLPGNVILVAALVAAAVAAIAADIVCLNPGKKTNRELAAA